MTTYNDDLSDYITRLFAAEDSVLQQVRQHSVERGLPTISISAEEGRWLQWLVRASGAMRVLEIGTLGGYSGIWLARGLADGGSLTTLEHKPLHAEVAREHFDLAGVADRVEVLVGDALQTLQRLGQTAPFDFIFIDADKPGYDAYLDWAVKHVRVGGIIAAHNAFGSGGGVLNPDSGENARFIAAFNQRVAEHPALLSTIFPAGDGTLAMVKLREA